MTVEAMKKFYAICNENARVAKEAGVVASNIPLMSMFASLIDIIEVMEHKAEEEQKEFIKTVVELTNSVSHVEDVHREDEGKHSEPIPSQFNLLGVCPRSERETTILRDLVDIGCESLEDIQWIRAVADKDCFRKRFYVMVKSRLAILPIDWNYVDIGSLSSMMSEKNLTLSIMD